MTDILLGIGLFTVIAMALSLIVLTARKLFASPVPVSVTINDNRRFTVLSQQKLLDILYQNDILVPSACAGKGTCGLCKVAVEQGGGEALPVERAKLHKTDLSNGTRLACQVTVREDIVVRVPDDLFGTQKWECKVASNRSLAPFTRELVLDLPADAEVDFRAGSFVNITIPPYQLQFRDFQIPPEHEKYWQKIALRSLSSQAKTSVTRAYSVANKPDETGQIVLNIRLALPPPSVEPLPPGVVSSYLFGLDQGEKVQVAGPYGEFGARNTDKEMVIIGGGVGVAPLRAIIFDQLIRQSAHRKISFWYGARSKVELYYENEFNELQKKYPNFSWTVALSNPQPDDRWNGPTGFIHQVVYDAYLKDHPSPEDCEFYLCGPPLMTRAVVAMLQEIGVGRDSIFNDDFGA